MNLIDSKPKLFAKSTSNIWTDSWIQKNMLKAHLDISSDGATRNHQAVKKTIDFIKSHIDENSCLLDLGCGPGIYTELLAKKGYIVTGIDFNKKAIEYARQHSKNVKYVEGDYLSDFPTGMYDAVIMIYCDMGTHSDEGRDNLLRNCLSSLKQGGKLIFDVFSAQIIKEKTEGRDWEYSSSAGFWADREYLLLKQTFHYPENQAFAYQYNLVLKEEQKHFIVWDRYYSEQEIIDVLQKIGFRNIHVTKGLLGQNSFTSSHEMFIVAEKA